MVVVKGQLADIGLLYHHEGSERKVRLASFLESISLLIHPAKLIILHFKALS